MRGAFVACFGDRADARLLEEVAGLHRWHHGTPELHSHGQLHVALLVDPSEGPTIISHAERLLVVHGAASHSLSELEQRGERFAALEWDGQELRSSRDPIGLCPLFYRAFDGAVWLSTEVQPLLALSPVGPDLLALASQAALVPQVTRTGLSGILRVLPGHRLHVSVDLRTDQRPYWNPAQLIDSFRGTHRQAEEELLARLIAAVDRCLDERSGILVSGGLDSTAIALSASGRKPHLVHVSFPQVGGAREDHHARAIADHLDVDLEVVTGDLAPWHPDQDLAVSTIPYMSPPPLTAEAGLARLAEDGVTTALDGNDGDGVLGYIGREWGELALTGRVGRLAKLARTYGAKPVLHGVVDDLVSPGLRLRELRGKHPTLTYLQTIERYFTEPLRSQMLEADLERWRPPRGLWRARQLRQVMPVTTVRMEEHELRGAHHGLDMRHPFADRELVEFLISLPASLKSDPFQPKALLRRALAGRGPDAVLHRPDKPLYFDVLGERVNAEHCLEWIQSSGVQLPMIDYKRLYADAASAAGVPLVLLMMLARAHVFAAAYS